MKGMNRLLVVYATRYGHSELIARRIAAVAGAQASVIDVRRVTDLLSYDAIVIVAPIYLGRHLKSIRRFVTKNRLRLASMRSAFVSVSGSAADPATRPHAEQCVNDFFRDSGWTASQTLLIGGAVNFTRYNPLVRWITKKAFSKAGQPLDTSRDYDFTDWQALERFASDFVSGSAAKVA